MPINENSYSCRAEESNASEDTPNNPSTEPTLGDIINARFSRRDMLRGALGAAAITALAPSTLISAMREARADAPKGRFAFEEIAHGVDQNHHVAPGYKADVLIRWGDPVIANAPAFDPGKQTADAQEKQFGYNNDYIGFVPLSESADHGLLCVNHEYTNEEVMFPGMGGEQSKADFAKITPELCEIEMAAHGGSVIEVKKVDGRWQVVKDSKYNRRISARGTAMTLSGPVAGHGRVKTQTDASGTKVIGTLNNCAGGVTPWGTYLMAEENFHGYFWGEMKDDHPEKTNYARYGVPGNKYAWGKYFDRFDINKEPNEANRFGWVVEVDPMDPASTPIKHTALGRFKHEGAESILNKDGRVVVYMGDDQRFDYLYKFVSKDTFNPEDAGR